MAEIAVIIPARNEENTIGKVIDSLWSQKYAPKMIIVVDDGSIDKTVEIAKKHNTIVIKNPEKHEDRWVAKPMFARIPNLALKEIYRYNQKSKGEIRYISMVGGDTVLSDNLYYNKIIDEMTKNNCVVAGGVIYNEPIGWLPRGSGRVIDLAWFQNRIRFFPEIYGWEPYVALRAIADGKKVCIVKDAVIEVERPTNLVKPDYGKAMRVLGYDPLYAILRSLYYMKYDIKNSVHMLVNYLIALVTLETYDKEVADVLRSIQRKQLLSKLKRLKLT